MKKCLLVLGMHRSGTSAFTGTLYNLNVNLGKTLLESRPDNPKGFFENKVAFDINNEIYLALNSEWSDAFALPENWWNLPPIKGLSKKIESFILKEFANDPIFALKDPRLCRLAPAWIKILKKSHIEPFFVIITRNPAEVAASLKKRNDMAPEVAHLLWLRHVLEAELYTRDHTRVFVSFETLIEQSNSVVLNAIKRLGLESDIDISPLIHSDATFIDKSMRHHIVTNNDCATFKLATDCYNILQSLSETNQAPLDAQKKIDEIRQKFYQLFDFFLSDEMCEMARMRSIKTSYGDEISHLKKTHREELERVQAKTKQETQALQNHYERKIKGAIYTLKCQNEFITAESKRLIDQLNAENRQLRENLDHAQSTVSIMRGTFGWQLADKTRSIAHRLLPPDSRRRKLGRLYLRSAKVLVREGPKSFLQKTGKRLPSGKLLPYLTRFSLANNVAGSQGQLHFEKHEHVQASIIIPVHNNWQFTWKCLLSIYHRTEGCYEVIVVDNGSTDDTAKKLSKLSGITVITNQTNEVFVTGCNQGAEAAKGEYLIFLNNDTEVTLGWLEALLDPFDDPQTGIVGARLLYPDGRLQEAGNIIWSDGTGWNYGHGDAPYRPQYSYRKEVDYCSGACLAISRRLWDKLGGFDLRYRPAYYEDTDLCFAARTNGYKVIYQPEAQIIHHGGASAGTDVSQGYKKYQEINKNKFYTKWQHTLAGDHCHGPEVINLARERGFSKRILIVDHYAPTFDKDSGSLRMYSLIRIFQEMNYKVIFWPDNREYDDKYTLALQRLGVEVYYGSITFEEFIQEHGRHLDVVLLSRPYIAKKYIQFVKSHSNAFTIYDTVDLHYLREERKAKLIVDQWRNLEFFLANESNATLVVSPIEKELLKSEHFSNKVHVVSNVHELQNCDNNFVERTGLMFIGGFDHPPNEDGILWFVNFVLPVIQKKLPGIHLTIVGSNPSKQITDLACSTIKVTGYVENVTPFFENARVFVCPLRYGAGVKGKLGHSFSFGLPAVTTTIGAEGMGLVHKENVLIADKIEDFAESVIELYTNSVLWDEISQNCRKVIVSNFSSAVIKKSLSKLLNESGNSKASRTVLLHCHLFKNAGSTFDWSLERFFGSRFLEHNDDQQMKKGSEYLGPFLITNKGISALSSHHVRFPLPNFDDINVVSAIIIRHPIDRVGSVYSFERRQKSNTPGAVHAKMFSFPEYVEWRLKENVGATIRDFQTRSLLTENQSILSDAQFELAINEFNKIQLVGVVDRYEESMVVFEHLLAKFFPNIDLSFIRQNVSKERSTSIDDRIRSTHDKLGDQLMERVMDQNKFDLKLYSMAQQRLTDNINKIDNFEEKLEEFRDRCYRLHQTLQLNSIKN